MDTDKILNVSSKLILKGLLRQDTNPKLCDSEALFISWLDILTVDYAL